MRKPPVIQAAVDLFGRERQIMQAIEEMAELTVELMHNLRGRQSSVATELADVEIMLAQLRIIFDEQKIDKEKTAKLKRLRQTIDDIYICEVIDQQ